MCRFIKLPLIAMVLALFGGCAAGPKHVRYLFPPPPDQPRLEYVDNYGSEYDVKKGRLSEMEIRVFGAQKAPVLRLPFDVALDREGALVVTDTAFGGLVIFDFAKAKVEFVSGVGRPLGIDIDSAGRMYVADSESKNVFILGPDRKVKGVIGEGLFKNPAYPLVNEDLGRLYVSDGGGHKIEVFSLDGEHLFSIGKVGSGDGEFFSPQGLAFDKQGRLFVVDMLNARIQVLDADGTFLYKFGTRGSGIFDFENPRDLVFDSEGNFYLTDGRRSTLSVYSPEGQLKMFIGSNKPGVKFFEFAAPRGLFIDSNDRIFVVDQMNKRISAWQYLNTEYLSTHPITEADKEKLLAEIEAVAKELEKKKEK